MANSVKYGTTLSSQTIKKIKQIAVNKRWNDNDVISVAVENFHAQLFPTPTKPHTAEISHPLTVSVETL